MKMCLIKPEATAFFFLYFFLLCFCVQSRWQFYYWLQVISRTKINWYQTTGIYRCSSDWMCWLCESNLMWIFARISFPFWAQFSKQRWNHDDAHRIHTHNIPISIQFTIYPSLLTIELFFSPLRNKYCEFQSLKFNLFVALLLLLTKCYASQLIYIYAIHIIVIISLFLTNKTVRLMFSCQTCSNRTYYLMEMTFFIAKETTKPIRKQNFLRTRCVYAVHVFVCIFGNI